MNWKPLAVCLLIGLSGCTIVDQPGHANTVSYSGDFNSSGDVFIMNGYLYQDGTDTQTLNNVSVCGYSEDGELLFAEEVLPFEVKRDVTIQSDRHPRYVTIYSDEFWESDQHRASSDGKLDSVRYWESLEKGYTPSLLPERVATVLTERR